MSMALELAQFSLLLLPSMKLKIPYLSFPRLLWVSAMESPGSLGLAQLHNQLCKPPHLNHNHSAFLSGSNGDVWQDRVARAVEKIKNDQLEKVVLARFVTGTSQEKIDQRKLLTQLASEYPSTWVYSNHGLVGATPELLVRLSKSLITSRILAGTIRKTGDDERDLALAGSLARSSKDLEEHEYAVRSVAEAL